MEEFRLWLLENEKSANTVDSYVRAVSTFLESESSVTKMGLVRFKNTIMKHYSPATVNQWISGLNSYCDFLGCPENKLKAVKFPSEISTENVINDEEYHRLLLSLSANKDMQGYFMVKFLAMTGARVSELIEFTKDDLHKGYLETWNKGKIRRIYIPCSLIKECETYYSTTESNFLFFNKAGGKISRTGVLKRLYSYSDCGIRKEVLHPHSFRHYFAIRFLENDCDLSLLADLMGHSNISTTARYTRLSKEQQIDRVNSAVNW